MTLSTALSNCLADIGISETVFAGRVYGKGFPGGKTLRDVQVEVFTIRTTNACGFTGAAFTEFWQRAFKCVGMALPAHVSLLRFEVGKLTLPRNGFSGFAPFTKNPGDPNDPP